ncbi:phytanoyl-CoA dioxygenase family protein [Streptomyces sp. CoT10]|uniref:phytanoyl-CoA dioxygenase family protein n=1 Tax=Streptomyces sp. CoT10 TaxID=2875762 RepID=UPI001CD6C62C|nr:phytanoyl-CoA dioxygenase family protein [Streptomyces sp. CoT10]
MKTLLSSADAADEIAELTSRLVRDGYVYLPGFLPADRVEPVTGHLRQALHGIGWLAGPDTSDVAPEAEPRFTGDSFRQIYPVIQRLEEFHRLAHDDRILRLMEGLLGGDIFCHPAKVCRISTPSAQGGAYFTRAHQDFVVLHTCSDVLTAWIPFTSCTAESQGLRILANSHRDGFLPTDASVGGARPLYLPVDADDPRWMTADYAVGDVVVFHSLTVHGGGPNTSNTVRLSADVRYQRTGDEPMRAEFAHPHGWPRTPDWDELCAGWSTRTWVDTPDTVLLEPMPTDVSYGEYLSTLVAPPSRLLRS